MMHAYLDLAVSPVAKGICEGCGHKQAESVAEKMLVCGKCKVQGCRK
jgi:hypothetical protein